MCGIVGYAGPKNVIPVIVNGLRLLEYRGYDSAGAAWLEDGQMKIEKTKGKLESGLCRLLEGVSAPETVGIGHTRWATHGEPSDVNSHPHTNVRGDIAIVHNGIIENFLRLKEWLMGKGVVFSSQTDTEVVAHLINFHYDGDLKSAVKKAVGMIEGSYALAVISSREPDRIIAVRKDSPLVIGVGKGENLLASDIPALLPYTRDVIFLEEDELAVITRDSVSIFDKFDKPSKKEPYHVEWDVAQAEKAGYPHFMIKEIEEQPRALADTLRISGGRLDISEMKLTDDELKSMTKLTIVACGTAYHAGCVAKYVFEKLLRVPVEVDIASEFRYRDPIFLPGQMMLVISQSGETADTIAAMREAQKRGVRVMAIVNAPGSTIARDADHVFYTRAGVEMAVASTKAYGTQLLSLFILALEIGRLRGCIDEAAYAEYLDELRALPEKAARVLAEKADIQHLAAMRFMEHSTFFIGRGLDYALAMESSLKLKEVSYVHSEAYAAGELKHGTIALIEDGTLVVALCTQHALLDKTVTNIKEVKARGAYVAAVAQESCKGLDSSEVTDFMIRIPDCCDMFAPILAVIPMQLFAYYVSVQKGCDVDRPRNLAKSVTVE